MTEALSGKMTIRDMYYGWLDTQCIGTWSPGLKHFSVLLWMEIAVIPMEANELINLLEKA